MVRPSTPLSLVEKAKREAKKTQDRAEEHSTDAKDHVDLDAQPVDNVLTGVATDVLRGDGAQVMKNAADRSTAAVITHTGSQQSAMDARAGAEGIQTLKDVAKDIQNENLVAAAGRAASGATRVAGMANRPLQELTEDLSTVVKVLTKPINAVRSVAKEIDFEL